MQSTNIVSKIEEHKENMVDYKNQLYTCKKCGEIKGWSLFVKNKERKSGIGRVCNACVAKAAKERIERNKAQADFFSNAPTTNTCTDCGLIKPRSEFYTDFNLKNGIRNQCRTCMGVDAKSPERKQIALAYKRKHHREDPRITMVNCARNRAKKKGIPFSIIREDVIMPLVCPIFGTPFEIGNKSTSPNSPSLDRIKPELGYVPGNIMVISHRANRIKNNATADEIEGVLNYTLTFSGVNLKQAVAETKIENKTEVKTEPYISTTNIAVSKNRIKKFF